MPAIQQRSQGTTRRMDHAVFQIPCIAQVAAGQIMTRRRVIDPQIDQPLEPLLFEIRADTSSSASHFWPDHADSPDLRKQRLASGEQCIIDRISTGPLRKLSDLCCAAHQAVAHRRTHSAQAPCVMQQKRLLHSPRNATNAAVLHKREPLCLCERQTPIIASLSRAIACGAACSPRCTPGWGVGLLNQRLSLRAPANRKHTVFFHAQRRQFPIMFHAANQNHAKPAFAIALMLCAATLLLHFHFDKRRNHHRIGRHFRKTCIE